MEYEKIHEETRINKLSYLMDIDLPYGDDISLRLKRENFCSRIDYGPEMSPDFSKSSRSGLIRRLFSWFNEFGDKEK